MRRASFVLVMVVALVVGSGVAFAAVKYSTDRRDALIGTNSEDVLHGRGGSDGLAGRGADDVLYGENGDDGKPERDLVYCSTGRDEVLADKLDLLYNCEVVERF